MGYDSNIKSNKSEQKQRVNIIISLIALSAVCFLAVSILRPPPIKKNSGASIRAEHVRQAAAIKALHGASSSQGGGQGDVVRSDAAPKKVDEPKSLPKNDFALPQKSEKEAATIRADLEAQVRAIKATGVIMEADEKSLEMTGRLQEATRELIKLRYGDFGNGNKKFRVKLDLEFQSTIPDFEEKGKDGALVIELAPISLIPCSVYNFLEIARTWKKGAFHRNAGHVLQAIARSEITQSMPFQEDSKEYPHKKGTVGYAGRPSGPEFYVSIQDHSRAHGPGSQQKRNPYEADCIIGTVIQGMEDGTVPRIHTMPGKEFLGDKKKWVWIRRMHILVPGDGPDGYVEFSSSPDVIPED